MAARLLLALCLALPCATAAASEAPMMLALTSASARPQVQAASQQGSVDLNSVSAEQRALNPSRRGHCKGAGHYSMS